MNNDPSRIKELFDKYMAGKASPEEIRELFKSSLEKGSDREFIALLTNKLAHTESDENYNRELWNSVFAQIKEDTAVIEEQVLPIRRKLSAGVRGMIAAAIAVIVFGAGIFAYEFLRSDKSVNGSIAIAADIAPGGNKAFLTLGNGKKISITDALNGQVAMENGVKISKAADGSLVYELVGNAGAKAVLNTFETPRGGTSEVILPDGTHVWLNAASSIKYLSSFAGLNERRVELSGEAYFEVAKDRLHPFIVKSSRQEVEVLGTHFNISDYNQDKLSRTTLLEGSVRVTGSGGNAVKVIKPDEQATVEGGTIKVLAVNGEDMLAWKNGEFNFNEENLEEIMGRVARWYDVEVVYADEKLKKMTFGGTVSRFSNISQVFEILELTDRVHFKIEGRTIIVSK